MTEPIPEPRLELLNSPSSPKPPLTEGTDVDLIRPAEPPLLKNYITIALAAIILSYCFTSDNLNLKTSYPV